MRDGWVETTLGDVAEVNMGQSPPGHTYNTEGIGMPFMQGSAEFGEHFPEPVKFCSAPAKIAEVGDLLLSVRAPVGDTNFANQRIAIGRGLATVRASAVSLTEFLRLVIQLNTAGLLATTGTGMFSSITGKNLKEFMILVPPIAEQKRIVDVVSSVDAYIDALQQQVDTARTARNAVLHELLTAGGDDWTETTLDAISLNLNSRRIPITKSDRNVGPFPYYGASGIVDYVDNFIFDECTLLISEDGANLTARSTPIAFSAQGKYWVNNHAHVLRFEDIATQTYVEFYLNAVRIDEWVTGAAQPKLNQKSLNEIPIPLPPIAEQKRIVEIVSSMDDVIQAAERAVVEAKSLRSGLLSDLLSGEHEIPVSYDELLGAA